MNQATKAAVLDDIVNDIADALECVCGPKCPLSMSLTVYNRATQGDITTIYDPSGTAGLVGDDPTTNHPTRGEITLGLPLTVLAGLVAEEQRRRARRA